MTNKEIAKLLGISPAALSIVINNKPGVSESTRTRVISKLQEMGLDYLIKKNVPVSTNNHNICFIIYKRDGAILDLHPFFLLLMEYVENQARNYGYNLLLSTIDRRKPIEPQIEHLNELNSQGAIIFATEMQDDDIDAFHNLSIPYVALDNNFPRLNCNTIAINNEMGTYQAIHFLVKSGHTRIGYLKSSNRISSFKERHLGYKTALAHFGLAFEEKDIWDVHYTEEGSYRDVRYILENLSRSDLPSAFVTDDDTIATGALRAFSEFHYKIPEEVSFIGYNDRPSCELTIPPLTTINVSKHALATEAVDELMCLIQHPENLSPERRSRKIRIGTKLVVRNSVNIISPN